MKTSAKILTAAILMPIISSWCAAQEPILWQNPGEIERVDFTRAAGTENPPQAAFHFVTELHTGTSPKVIVLDNAGVRWRVKGGPEARPESFSTRLVGALGYHVEPTWFVARGRIDDVHALTRAARFIHPDGSFSNASFERRDPDLKSVPQSWAWNNNPFVGTDQLNGLKVLVMLLSDWDNKDVRDQRLGSNTAIYERRISGGQLIYGVTDWGRTLGGWIARFKPKTLDCDRFTEQTKSFLEVRKGNHLEFGFKGQHTDDFKNDITVQNVRWLLQYLGSITDAQLRDGLQASGATPNETSCFAIQLRERIKQLKAVARS